MIFSLAIAIQIILVLSTVNRRFLFLSAALLLIAFLIYTAFSVVKCFLILTFYISCFEVTEYLVHFPGLPLLYDWKIAYPLFGLLIIYWFVYLLREKIRFEWNQMDTAVFVFYSLMLLGIVHGYLRDYDPKRIFVDGGALPLYIAYFILLYSSIRNNINLFYDFLLICSIIVSLQFFYAVAQFKTLFVLQRIVTRHIHLALFAIPYLMTTLIYSTSRKRRILFSILLPFPVLGVLFSQQRALYASTALIILFLIGVLAYTRRGWIRQNLTKFISTIVGIIVSILLISIIIQIVTGGKFLLTLYGRFYVFMNIHQLNFDASWRIRWLEIERVFQNFKNFWLFGRGFGAMTTSRSRLELQITLDNTYAYLIWKTGIIGLSSFLYMHFVFLKRSLATFRKRITENDKIMVLTAMINTVGLMFIGMTNSSLAHYRFMFVWAALFACAEIIARKYE
jgi:hypothetical protein